MKNRWMRLAKEHIRFDNILMAIILMAGFGAAAYAYVDEYKRNWGAYRVEFYERRSVAGYEHVELKAPQSGPELAQCTVIDGILISAYRFDLKTHQADEEQAARKWCQDAIAAYNERSPRTISPIMIAEIPSTEKQR